MLLMLLGHYSISYHLYQDLILSTTVQKPSHPFTSYSRCQKTLETILSPIRAFIVPLSTQSLLRVRSEYANLITAIEPVHLGSSGWADPVCTQLSWALQWPVDFRLTAALGAYTTLYVDNTWPSQRWHLPTLGGYAAISKQKTVDKVLARSGSSRNPQGQNRGRDRESGDVLHDAILLLQTHDSH